MKVAIYARISTTNKGQDADNQVMILREFCKKMDYHVYKEYVDQVSGGTSDRPQFKAMFLDASKHRFSLVLFWSLDRFSRRRFTAARFANHGQFRNRHPEPP